MKKFCIIALITYSLIGGSTLSKATIVPRVSEERLQLIREIQQKLNLSFHCEFSVHIGQTRKYATANSSGIIMIDRSFLQSADPESIFFAIAHEYAHAYLQHDVLLYGEMTNPKGVNEELRSWTDTRRHFEKEADGIAARKAKQMGFAIEGIIKFILEIPDLEKGVPAEDRVYSKPSERAHYILAVFQSS